MRWIVPVVFGVLLLGVAGFFALAMQFQATANAGYAEYEAVPYAVGAYPVPYGSGPEWDKFRKAEKAGANGYVDMQGLMLSSEPDVALYASHHLADSHSEDAFRLLYDQLPKVSRYAKDSFRTGSFTSDVYLHSAQTVLGDKGSQREGALLFLKLPMSSASLDQATKDRVFNTLVQAVPKAEGTFATELAFAIGNYEPTSPQPLVDMLKHGSATVRNTAVTALGKLKREDVLADVQKLKSDPVSKVRDAALTAEVSIKDAVALRASYITHTVPGTPQETVANKRMKQQTRSRLGMP